MSNFDFNLLILFGSKIEIADVATAPRNDTYVLISLCVVIASEAKQSPVLGNNEESLRVSLGILKAALPGSIFRQDCDNLVNLPFVIEGTLQKAA